MTGTGVLLLRRQEFERTFEGRFLAFNSVGQGRLGGMEARRWLLLLCLLVTADGLKTSTNVTFNVFSRVNQVVPWFGMAQGGTVDLKLKVASPGWPSSPPPEWVNLYFVMFNYRQWVSYELQNYIASDELNYACKNDDHQCVQLCSLPSVRRYQIWGSPHSPQQERSISYNITETQEYTMVILSCTATTKDTNINVAFDLDMLNPGGTHISLEKAPLVPMFYTLFAIYLVMCGACTMMDSTLRYSPGSLGKLMGICVFVKTLDVVSNVAYYQTYAATGRDSTQLHQLTHAAETLSGGAFLGLLLLLCLGWGITRPDLSRREKRMFWGVCVLYVVFGLLHSICETPSICQGYLMSFWIVKFMMTFAVIVAVNANIERLRQGGFDQARPTTPTELYLKLSLFLDMRTAFLATLILPVALMMIDVTVLSWEQEWMSVLLQELLYIVVYTGLITSFRKHQSRMRELLLPIDTAEEDAAAAGEGEGEEMREGVGGRVVPGVDGDERAGEAVAGAAQVGGRRSPPPVESPGAERGAVYRRNASDGAGGVAA